MRTREAMCRIVALMLEATDKRIRLQMASASVLVIMGGALAALAPLALKHLVDAAAAGVSHGAIASAAVLGPGAIYVVVLCAGRIVGDVRPILANEIEQRLMTALRHRFFAHVLRLPLASVLRKRGGELLHSFDLGRAGAQLLLTHLINSFAPIVVELAVMAVILAQLGQPGLILLFSVTAMLYLAVFAVGSMRLTRHARTVTDASIAVHGELADGLSNVETLRCFGAEGAAEKKLAGTSWHLVACWRRYYRTSAGTALAATAVFGASLAGCLVVTSESVVSGSLSVGDLVLSCVYLLQLMRPLEVIGSAGRDMSRAVEFAQPLLAVLAEAPEPGQPTHEVPSSSSSRHAPSIRFEGVTFGYDPDRPVIHGLDLEITAGTTTAIVGPSGSGKSSLIRLLLRLYEPQAGRILLNNCPIDSVPLAKLRAGISLVPQDTTLLHASMATNIALGVPEAAREAIARAAMAAQLHRAIESMPDGYDTLVGERGLKLSGGERQRLAIARALLRRSPLVLLDEPTSMLDSKTEAKVLLAVRRAAAGSTMLIVAHRLSTVMDADEIIVLDQGLIRERGTHKVLLALKGLYSQLWRRQLKAGQS